MQLTSMPYMQVGVFDTAYHATMPPKAFMYGLPYDLYEQHRIRRWECIVPASMHA